MPANDASAPFTLPHRIGSHPFFGCGGLVGGIALVAAAIGIAAAGITGSRGGAKLVGGLGIGGLVLLATSFRVVGAEFRQDGIQTWKYLMWFLGSRRTKFGKWCFGWRLGSGGRTVLSTQYPVLSTRAPSPVTQYSVLRTRNSVPG